MHIPYTRRNWLEFSGAFQNHKVKLLFFPTQFCLEPVQHVSARPLPVMCQCLSAPAMPPPQPRGVPAGGSGCSSKSDLGAPSQGRVGSTPGWAGSHRGSQPPNAAFCNPPSPHTLPGDTHTHVHTHLQYHGTPPHPRPDLGPEKTKQNKACSHCKDFCWHGSAGTGHRLEEEEGGGGGEESTAEFNVSLQAQKQTSDVANRCRASLFLQLQLQKGARQQVQMKSLAASSPFLIFLVQAYRWYPISRLISLFPRYTISDTGLSTVGAFSLCAQYPCIHSFLKPVDTSCHTSKDILPRKVASE